MKSLIVANWKMNPASLKEAEKLFDSVKKALLRQGLRTGEGIKNIKDVEVVICPPSLYISKIKNQKSKIKLGAQDCFWEEKGAYTGEVSATMLKNLGIEYVIVGHSERRKYFKETDEEINKKVKAVLTAGLKAILCIGESAEERKNNRKNEVLKSQLEKDLDKITQQEIKNVVIAYEPVWAIGTGDNCSVEETTDSIKFIRQLISEFYNKEISENIRIIYGGSVNSQNSADYIKKAGANGLLPGGASLKADEFIKMVESAT